MYIGCDTYELVHGKYTLTLDEINDLVFELQEHRVVRVDHYLSDLKKIRRLEQKVEDLQKKLRTCQSALKKATKK